MNSKIFDPHRLLVNLIDETNLKKSDKYDSSSNLSIYYTWKNMEESYETKKFKISALTGMKSLNYLMDHLQY